MLPSTGSIESRIRSAPKATPDARFWIPTPEYFFPNIGYAIYL